MIKNEVLSQWTQMGKQPHEHGANDGRVQFRSVYR